VKKPTGNIVVSVSLEDGASFSDGTVVLKEKKVKLKKDQRAVPFLGVPIGTYAPAAEIFVKQGWFKPKKRYLGIVPVNVVAGKSTEIEIVARPVADIEEYCSACHPYPGQENYSTGMIQLRRDVHHSGEELGPKFKEQVKAFNKRIKKAVKDGVPHSYPILLEERNGKEFYTCESCHTVHSSTPYGSYAIADFKEESALCRGCHY
jgi:predicted CXXCH cytochrome family protein